MRNIAIAFFGIADGYALVSTMSNPTVTGTIITLLLTIIVYSLVYDTPKR